MQKVQHFRQPKTIHKLLLSASMPGSPAGWSRPGQGSDLSLQFHSKLLLLESITQDCSKPDEASTVDSLFFNKSGNERDEKEERRWMHPRHLQQLGNGADTERGRYEKHGEWWESSSARQTGGKRMKSYTLTAWLKHNPLRYHRIPKVS